MHPCLNMALRVMIQPNSAFTEIRDNDQKYFAWSVGIYVLGAVLWAVITVPLDDPASGYWEAAVLSTVVSIPSGIISIAVIYLVGRRLGGNASWRKVFSAIFYAHVYAIPMFVVLMALMLPTVGLIPLYPLDGPGPADVGIHEITSESLNAFRDIITFWIVLTIIMVAFVIWGLVLLVKAVKTVNGFGTAKAFGIIVLGSVVSIVIFAPFSI